MKNENRNRLRQSELLVAFWLLAKGREDRPKDDPEPESLEGWINAWGMRDRTIGKHRTQLEALATLFRESLNTLSNHLAALDLTSDVEEFYGSCREYDEAIVWLRRVWEYFSQKIDQRLESRAEGKLLQAADEVVWSCFRPVFTRESTRQYQGPTPLAFIAPEYSPAALLKDKPAVSLTPTADLDFLEGFLKTLPIPLLRLPPWCMHSPWWLVYIGHEVGHHVQAQLGLSSTFAKGVRETVADSAPVEQKYSPVELDQWTRWSDEIFADVFSAIAMGPSALKSILEAELSPANEMVRLRRSYPAPVIRLALLQKTINALAGSLDETWDTSLMHLDVDSMAKADKRTERDLCVTDSVVAYALGELGGIGMLRDVPGCLQKGMFAISGRVEWWASFLTSERSGIAEHDLETSRLVAAGSFSAWLSYIGSSQASVSDRQALATKTVTSILETAHPGVRATLVRARAREGVSGQELISKLLETAHAVRALEFEAG